jgi:hypothetical protein
VLAALDPLADGRRRTDPEIAQVMDSASNVLRRIGELRSTSETAQLHGLTWSEWYDRILVAVANPWRGCDAWQIVPLMRLLDTHPPLETMAELARLAEARATLLQNDLSTQDPSLRDLIHFIQTELYGWAEIGWRAPYSTPQWEHSGR